MDAHEWRRGGPSTETHKGGRTDGGDEVLPFGKRKCSAAVRLERKELSGKWQAGGERERAEDASSG